MITKRLLAKTFLKSFSYIATLFLQIKLSDFVVEKLFSALKGMEYVCASVGTFVTILIIWHVLETIAERKDNSKANEIQQA